MEKSIPQAYSLLKTQSIFVSHDGEFYTSPFFFSRLAAVFILPEKCHVPDMLPTQSIGLPEKGLIGKKSSSCHLVGARWFDPELGMWLTPDPVRQFANPYSYGGDPINGVDPDGRCFEPFTFTLCVVGAVGGAYLGGSLAQNLTSNKATEWNPVDWKWKEAPTYFGIVGGGLAGALVGYAAGPGVVGSYSMTLGFEGLTIPLATVAKGAGVSVLGGLGYYAFDQSESDDQSEEPTEVDEVIAQIQAEQNGTRVAGLETPLDILGLGYDAYQLSQNPNWENGAYFVQSLAAVAIPGVPGSWAFRGAVKAGAKAGAKKFQSPRAAMRAAKRDAGIPTSQTHQTHNKNVRADRLGGKGIDFVFESGKTIQHHPKGHAWKKNPLGPHFNNHPFSEFHYEH